MADPNVKFLVYLKKLGENPEGYRVAHLHVSQLPPGKKSRDNLSRAITTFTDLRNRYREGEVFLMKNLDIIFITADISKPALASVCEQVEQSFVGQAGVAFTNVHGGEAEFFTLFDLSHEYTPFLAWAEDVAGVAQAGHGQDPLAEPKGVVDLQLLGRIKEELQKIDITPMLFNQPVYHIGENGKTLPLFSETYISIQVLEDMFCPGLSLTSRRWLFNDLTEEMDHVVLSLLADPVERGGRKRMSLNVNITSLASESFIKFDAELPPEHRQGVVLEINKTDFFEHSALFAEVAPFLRGRGYRLLLDGLSLPNLLALDGDGLDFDFAKLFWSESDLAALTEEQMTRITTKVKGQQKILFILARCDSADSIRFAKSLGIRLIQGRLVDHMVKKDIPF
jgi:EAL domain-containing protein (putative c-di-GMP-specific phosphodiesterase class I)